MTRQHFNALAFEISLIVDDAARRAAAQAVAQVCRRFSPAFDTNRFFKACGVAT